MDRDWESDSIVVIVDATTWQTWSTIEVTGPELASTQLICSQVQAAIFDLLQRQFSQTFDEVIDAPRTDKFQLLRYYPFSILNVYFSLNANGNPTNFDNTTLLTLYTDYIVKGAVVQSLTGSPWAVGFYQQPYAVAPKRVNVPGAIRVTGTGGFTVVPPAIQEAACMAVSKVREQRARGMLNQGESWNGYSYSGPSAATISSVLGDPNILDLLNPYFNYADRIG